MKRLLMLISLALLAGCGNKLQSKVAGVWKIDTATLTGSSVSAMKQSPVYKQLLKQLETNTFEFKKDGTLFVSAFGKSGEAGKWTLNDHNILVTASKPSDTGFIPSFKMSDDGSRVHMVSPDASYSCDLFRSGDSK